MGMEKVSAFGKPVESKPAEAPNSNRTVTETVTQESVAAGSGAQAIEKVGAGDGI